MLATLSVNWTYGCDSGRNDRTVVLTPELMTALALEQRAQTGKEPSPEELKGALTRYVEEEALYREALRQGLDRGDPVIRRRLIQTMRLVLESEVEIAVPSEKDLKAFAMQHGRRFGERRFDFEHLFFSRDRRGNEAALAAATLVTTFTDADSDPFVHGRSFTKRRQSEIATMFGSDFARAITSANEGVWSPPVNSLYGWHRIHVHGGVDPDWREERQLYLEAWRQAQLSKAVAAKISAMAANYRIEEN